MATEFSIIAMYRFVRLDDDLPARRERVRAQCRELRLKGTVLLAHEGVNAFVAGTLDAIAAFKDLMRAETGCDDLVYKESASETPPFHRMLVKIKKEIISLGEPSIEPTRFTAPRLAPQDLKAWLDQGRPVVLLDTRNGYEIESGTFAEAQDLRVDSFRDFGRKIRAQAADLQREWRDKPIVTYCTGGIRCEKASALMLDVGFNNVYQLDGGILNYFEKCGGAHYQGDCFVFDWRLAVNSKLEPAQRTGDDPVEAGRHKI